VEQHVVIGTAGHIDHGKTSLVKALTGVDTDRLAEEKARGITIDLGFAPLALDGVAASIVDVPGHEGFIRNMVAGATGVDLALLVVAADEGVMPQTREHLAILRHLGVVRGVVALTKCDIAPDAAWRELVADDVRALLQSELGADWPVLEVSATDGSGLDELKAELTAQSRLVDARAADDRFRLPVDRVFALAGAGTIVTGTVWSGAVREGESVTVLPAGVTARVRSVQVHGQAAEQAGPGRRAALALVGVAKEQAPRGSVVVSGIGWRASRAIDVAVSMAPDVPLKLRSRVHVHHGTAEVMARVARLGATAGSVVAARLALDEPLVARAGDRFVLRSWSPVTTIGGGLITDPWAEREAGQRRRRNPPEIPTTDDAAHVAALVQRRGAGGIAEEELAVASGYNVSRLTVALAGAQKLGMVSRAGWLVEGAEVEAASQRMRDALNAFHEAHPLEPGMSAQAWRGAARAGHELLVELAEQRLEVAGDVVREGALVRQPSWNPATSNAALENQERVLGILRTADAEPPTAAEVAAALPGLDVGPVLRMLVRSGRAVPVADRYYEFEALGRERQRLLAALRLTGPASPASIREHLGRSRKWLIPLLEWADREGLTVRDGDRRTLRDEQGA
jgi:selenocysteine-specific elongation factor